MSALIQMLERYSLPPVARVRQEFDRTRIADPAERLRHLLRERALPVKPGDRIAITAGSRGIAHYLTLMQGVAEYVRERGGKPFLVPSMGSHGGGTAAGQVRLLANLGITEESVGAPILSSMEVNEIGRTEIGLPVYIDRNACEADGIILLNRVKTHTSIREQYQSGLVKMLAIGLAKHKGAAMTHATGVPNLGPNMVRMGLFALKHLNIVGGVSSIENGYGELADIYVERGGDIADTEPAILARAIAMLPRICIDQIDCLIVCAQGKNISGTGMDPAVIGRPINRRPNEGPSIETLGVLRLTPESDGNASGCGMADFVTRRLRNAVNEEYTMTNSLTGMHPRIAAIPATLDSDRLVFLGCRHSCGKLEDNAVRLVIIKNTKDLNEVYMSPSAMEVAQDNPRVTRETDFAPLPFDGDGNLQLFGM